jgi:ubiquinone biosynthesis monooxygenase Coq7
MPELLKTPPESSRPAQSGKEEGLSRSDGFGGQGLPPQVLSDLRTDHAGEVGAVCIYQGILRVSKNPSVRDFAQHHLTSEKNHLRLIESWLPPAHFSRLLPVWQLAGFITGALPALFGPRAVYATIKAVETFVDLHYAEQILALESETSLCALRHTLLECQADEVAHRCEAAAALGPGKLGLVLSAWCSMVASGSRFAVALCRHV